jgi:hypothetical protein
MLSVKNVSAKGESRFGRLGISGDVGLVDVLKREDEDALFASKENSAQFFAHAKFSVCQSRRSAHLRR